MVSIACNSKIYSENRAKLAMEGYVRHCFLNCTCDFRELFKDKLLPEGTQFIGYARSDLTVAALRQRVEPYFKVNVVEIYKLYCRFVV